MELSYVQSNIIYVYHGFSNAMKLFYKATSRSITTFVTIYLDNLSIFLKVLLIPFSLKEIEIRFKIPFNMWVDHQFNGFDFFTRELWFAHNY
jgi:hypothetical protein